MKNRQFDLFFQGFSFLLPYLSGIILIANYAAAGYATYLFLSSVMGPIIGPSAATLLGAGVGIGVQGFRAVIVYFDLMTPNRLSFDKKPEVVALAFTVFTMSEIYLLGGDMGIELSAIVSLCGLQVAGYMAEINLLRQFRYIINYHLSTNPAKVKELVRAHTNQANLEAYLDKVEEAMSEKGVYISPPDLDKFLLDGDFSPEKQQVPPPTPPAAPAPPHPEMYPEGRDFEDAEEINKELESRNYHNVVAVPRSQYERPAGPDFPPMSLNFTGPGGA